MRPGIYRDRSQRHIRLAVLKRKHYFDKGPGWYALRHNNDEVVFMYEGALIAFYEYLGPLPPIVLI